MFEDKNMYITETGALMSAHDYSFLSTDQQSKYKVYKMETNNKPDFRILSEQYADSKDRRMTSYHQGIMHGYSQGCEKIWNDYVIPERQQNKVMHKELREADRQIIIKKQQLQERDAKIAELTGQNTSLAESYSKLQVRFGESETENQALKSELDKANELLKECAIELDDIEGYGIARKLNDFLKDKR